MNHLCQAHIPNHYSKAFKKWKTHITTVAAGMAGALLAGAAKKAGLKTAWRDD